MDIRGHTSAASIYFLIKQTQRERERERERITTVMWVNTEYISDRNPGNKLFVLYQSSPQWTIILDKYWLFSHFIEPIFSLQNTKLYFLFVSLEIYNSFSRVECGDSRAFTKTQSVIFFRNTQWISVILILHKEFGIKLLSQSEEHKKF